MTYSPECVAAFEANFPPAGGTFFNESTMSYCCDWACASKAVQQNAALAAFAANWERVRELEEALAALEQGEAVVLQYTGEDGEECYTTIKAKALQFDANPTPLYTALPSTAEAQARALEDAADNLLNQADRMENSVVSQRATRDAAWFLSAEAKRIREEG